MVKTMSNTILVLLVNGLFAVYFMNKIIKTDYQKEFNSPRFVYFFDGLGFSLNVVAVMTVLF